MDSLSWNQTLKSNQSHFWKFVGQRGKPKYLYVYMDKMNMDEKLLVLDEFAHFLNTYH